MIRTDTFSLPWFHRDMTLSLLQKRNFEEENCEVVQYFRCDIHIFFFKVYLNFKGWQPFCTLNKLGENIMKTSYLRLLRNLTKAGWNVRVYNTHTHTHTALSLSLSLPPLSLSLSLFYAHTHTHTVFVSESLSFTHTHTVSLSLSLSLSYTHTHTHAHTHTHTHTHTVFVSEYLSLFLSLFLSLSHSHTHTHTHTVDYIMKIRKSKMMEKYVYRA